MSLFVGTKIEHNDFTGWEFQPSGRLVWSVTKRQTLWAAVTRAVRTPSRVDNDLRSTLAPRIGFPNLGIPAAQVSGSSGVDSEKEMAYELGYRVQPANRLSFDLALFYNQYDQLISYRPVGIDAGTTPPLVQLITANAFEGETWGGELASRWEVTSWWSLRPSYTLLQVHLHPEANSRDIAPTQQAGGSPQQQFAFRSQMDLPMNFQLDAGVRYVDQLPGLAIPSYTVLDLRLGWRPIRNLEFSIVAQNLVDPHHPEFRTLNGPLPVPEVERSVYAKATWRF